MDISRNRTKTFNLRKSGAETDMNCEKRENKNLALLSNLVQLVFFSSVWFTLPVESNGMLSLLVLSTLYISKWRIWVFFFGMGGGYFIFNSNIVKKRHFQRGAE